MDPSRRKRAGLRVSELAGADVDELARDAGVPLGDVQDGLGHADPRTTRRCDHGAVRLDRSPGYTLAREFAGHPEQPMP